MKKCWQIFCLEEWISSYMSQASADIKHTKKCKYISLAVKVYNLMTCTVDHSLNTDAGVFFLNDQTASSHEHC